jgi:LysM repeat protein
VNRLALAAAATMLVVVPLAAAACGDEGDAGATLPPIVTTTSTSMLFTTSSYVASYYEVARGDNLGNIARRLGVDMAELMALNNIVNPNEIEAGQSLLVPPPTTVAESAPAG